MADGLGKRAGLPAIAMSAGIAVVLRAWALAGGPQANAGRAQARRTRREWRNDNTPAGGGDLGRIC